jgi:putative transposase
LHHKNVAHRPRPAHNFRHPVHVTLRVRRGLPSFRRQVVFLEVRNGLTKASRKGFRLVHFSVQMDHIHLVVEAADKVHLSGGTAGLEIRVARAVNRAIGRKGKVFGERYHARPLKTPREVRHAIVYVLQNWLKHAPHSRGVDRCSSGWWFTGWKMPPSSGPPAWTDADPAPVALPRTWLGVHGWRRGGLISSEERPKLDG